MAHEPPPLPLEPLARGRRRAALRRRLGRCLGLSNKQEGDNGIATTEARHSSSSASSSASSSRSGSGSHSWSDTEVLTPLAVGRRRRAPASPAAAADGERSTAGSPSASPLASGSPLSASGTRKGVQYARDGGLVCCRFCDILRARDEHFLYEDAEVAVFRPLAPAVESHVLVVPRCHIRNVNMLTERDSPLLRRMRDVARLVLKDLPASSRKKPHVASASSGSTSSLPSPKDERENEDESEDDVECKLAFHTPPFNSIDHVHMHAFRTDQQSFFGCVGAIKYRTATWWCRSFDEVMARLDADADDRKKSKLRRRRHQSEDQASCARLQRRVAPRRSNESPSPFAFEGEAHDEQALPVMPLGSVI